MMKNKSNRTDFLVKCSVCESDLNPDDAVILEEKDQKTTAHITCSKCKSAAMVFLSNNQAGLLSIGMATDLDSQEAKERFNSEAISADEVLDLYQFVSEEKGDIVQLVKNSDK